MSERSEAEVTARLARVYRKHCDGRRPRPLRLSSEALRRIADRSRIEDGLWGRISKALLDEHGLIAFRSADHVTLLARKLWEAWDEVAPRAVAAECRSNAPADGLLPQSAWPFPTGRK